MSDEINFDDLLKIAEQMKPVLCVIYVVDDYWPHKPMQITQEKGEAIIINGKFFKLMELSIEKRSLTSPTEAKVRGKDYNFCTGIPIKRISAPQAAEIVCNAIKIDNDMTDNAVMSAETVIYREKCPEDGTYGQHWWIYRQDGSASCSFCKTELPENKRKEYETENN